MQVLIVKDAATKVPREVGGMEDVLALRAQGFVVELPGGEPDPEQAPEKPAEPAPAKTAAAKKTAKR
jgi:hypothetical protein